MICVRCDRDNHASARFCRDCGVPLGRTCPTCAFANSAESTFCGGCGGRLAEVQSEDALGERRQLTVLFCDVVGSTHLSEILDPEDFGLLLAEYQRICGEAVRAHGGHISQYLGDGVVVYFGYPRSYEDEPQRAVRCGLDILAGVRALHESGRFPPETSMAVRLGAHTGRVVVGPVGAGDRRDRLALGSTPNIAARLQGEARPGTLLVSDDTWRIVGGYFRGRPLGPRRFKGVAEPVDVWHVVAEGESKERVEVARVLTPFVGRWPERAALEETWNECVSGASRFVMLRGESGIGKSRLVQTFRDEVKFTASHVLEMRTTPYSTSSPFQPVIDLLERRWGLRADLPPEDRSRRLAEGLEQVARVSGPEAVGLISSLLALPGAEGGLPDLPPARRRMRTLELLVSSLTAFASTGPTLLLVEDLHWADSSTLEFLELLIATAPDVPLMGVFLTRPDVLLEADEGALRTIELAGLDRPGIELMVRGVALGKALPRDLMAQIVARSDGVPLFVEELTRAVLESGLLRERGVAWEAIDAIADELIPATVDASLMSRIDRLGASRATAQLAATIGREFSLALLREVSERDVDTLTRDVDRMEAARLVRQIDTSARYEFRHALVRDAAYNSLLRTARQAHHRRIAEALRRSEAHEAAARPDLIARHLAAAGEDADAVGFWEAAGRQALARTATHVAAAHFHAAIQCLHRLPESPETTERELELQILLAPLLMTVHGWAAAEVEHACQRALELAIALQRYDRSYPPRWGLWTVLFLRGELLPATEAAEALLGAALASGVPMLEVTGRHALSYTLFSCGHYSRAVAEADAGLRLFDLAQERQLAALFGLSSSLALRASRGFSLWMLGHVEEAKAELTRMVALARELGHPPSHASGIAFAMYGEAFWWSYGGDGGGLEMLSDTLIELCRDDDFFLWHALAATFRAIVALGRGEPEAQAQMLDGLELWERAGARLTLVMMNVFCAEALYRAGEDEAAAQRLDAAESELPRGEGPMVPEIWRLRGRILARAGKTDAAEAAYRRAFALAAGQGAVPLQLRAALDLADLLADSGRAADAAEPLADALRRCPEGLDRPEPARAAALLGALRGDDLAGGGSEPRRHSLSSRSTPRET